MQSFYLAGSAPQGSKGEETFHNIFQSFDAELMGEAFNVSPDLIRRMQSTQEERGLSVMARESMRYIRPDEEESYSRRRDENGFEETLCTMKIRSNIENQRDADIYSREAGKLKVVDMHRLPILSYIDMSAEKGTLFPKAMLSPHWAKDGHTVVYVTRGEAKVEIVDHSGQTMMDDRVSQGDMFVVPQFYTTTAQAGNEGFEWVAFKTSGYPMRNDMAGYTSALRGMPLQVLTNAYQMSPAEAHSIKTNRGTQTFLLSPPHRSAKHF